MNEHNNITDDELTEMEANLGPAPLSGVLLDCRRLLFALRESRAEINRLQRIVDGWGKLEFSSRWVGPA